MKVSVITVAFNSAATIADTLASVAAQTHPDIEHIVIDGASTDNTVALVRQHGTRVASLVSERDRGIYDAMNKGLKLATGDLIGFLNADDVYADDGAVSAIVNAATLEPSASAVYGDLVYAAQDDLTKVIRLWRSGSFAHTRLRYGWMPPHPTFYVRADRLASIGQFDDTLRIAADYDFMLRTLSGPQVTAAYVPRVLVKMRAGGASNQSLKALVRKSREDLQTLRRNGVGGWFTLGCKNLRKIPQFFARG